MKKLSLVWVFLLCTPLLFAGNIGDIFQQWQKKYENNPAVAWELNTASAAENEKLRSETGIQDLSLTQVTGFDTKSTEVLDAMRKDIAKLKVKQPYVSIFDKEVKNTRILLVGVKQKEEWTDLYVVFLQSDGGGSVRIEGSLSDASYQQHIKKYMDELEQMFAMITMMEGMAK